MQIPMRVATLTDIPAILEIEQLSFDSDRFSRRQFHYLISKAKASFTVVEAHEKVAAYAILLLPKTLNSARIYSVAVHPNAKGTGYGRLLVQGQIKIAQEMGFQQIKLEVRDDNAAAIQLYESLGFHQVAIKHDYYEDGMQARVYRLTFIDVTPQN